MATPLAIYDSNLAAFSVEAAANSWGVPAKKLAEISETLAEGRYILMKYLPFFGHLVASVPWSFAAVKTAACTNQGMDKGGYGRIYFDPRFLALLTREQIIVVWIHEILHLAMGYFPRKKGRPDGRWNRAHDYVINLVIESFRAANPDLRLEWPKVCKPLLDIRFKAMIGEEVDSILAKEEAEQAKQEQQKKQEPQQGNSENPEGEQGSGQEGSKESEKDQTNGKGEGKGKDGDKSEEKGQGTDGAEGRPGEGEPSEDEGSGEGDGSEEKGQDSEGTDGRPGTGGKSDQSEPKGGKGGHPQGDEAPEGPRDDGEGYNDATDCITYESENPEAMKRGMRAMEDRWKNLLAEALTIHKMRGAGTLPGEFEAMVQSMMKPRVSWMDQYIHLVEGRLRSPRVSYQRPSKRSQAAGMLLPGRAKKKARIGIVDDTSMSTERYRKLFLGVTRQLVDTCDTEVRHIQVDTKITSDEEIEDMEAFMRKPVAYKGFGGTCFDAVPEALMRNGEPVELVVILTDGQPVHWPDPKAWPCPVIVVTTETMPPKGYWAVKIELPGDSE